MSAQAEHALRTLGDELDKEAFSMRPGEGCRILQAMARAHRATADKLQAEREERERSLYENESGFRYDKAGGKRAAKGG